MIFDKNSMIEKIKKAAGLTAWSAAILFSASLYWPFPGERLEPAPVVSLSLVDRHDTLLREILSDDGGRCRWVKLEEVSPELLDATLAAEDRYFYCHPGVNPLAVIRALSQNIRHGRVVSGASTITQQVVRNIFRSRRTLFAKLHEIWLAVRLDRTIPKDKILEQYLNRIYYGNQAYGIAAAARLYFDKAPRDLSLAEAAFLAGLPRSPSAHDPYRNFDQAKKRQERILRRMSERGDINRETWQRANAEPLQLVPARTNFRAPHFCEFVLQQLSPSSRHPVHRIRTTLDYRLQEKVAALVRGHIDSLRQKNISNAAVIVMDNATGEILSMVGSKDFFDDRHDGQVNGAVSLRQPGSTLKPFTYGLALERGMTAAEILEDKDFYFPTPGGTYSPQNYDQKYHGTVRLRQALACSYNIPAVSLLDRLGPDLLYRRLKLLGFRSLVKSPVHYGVGLTLGNGEVTLLELTRAYAALARGGIYLEDRAVLAYYDTEQNKIGGGRPEKPRQVFSPEIAFILTDILADRDARIPAFGTLSSLNLPFDCAVKTGTTVDFRDNWTVGYTPRYTVGVWVGNFDAAPMHNISGVTGCGPLFKDIMLLLENKNTSIPFAEASDVAKVNICPLSGKLATEHCPGAMADVFIRGTEPRESCPVHAEENRRKGLPFLRADTFEIAFPRDRDVFKMDPILRSSFQRIKLRAAVSRDMAVDRVEWWVGGQKIGDAPYPFSLYWNMKPGFHRIKAVAIAGKQRVNNSSVEIKVEE